MTILSCSRLRNHVAGYFRENDAINVLNAKALCYSVPTLNHVTVVSSSFTLIVALNAAKYVLQMVLISSHTILGWRRIGQC